MKFTAAGDAIIARRIQNNYEGYGEISEFVNKGDARFFNLETTLNEIGECYASQFSGGTYLRTSKKVLPDLEKFGFNLTTFNNNHAMDFSYPGLLSTLEALDESNLVHAGAGTNLAEASMPKYLDTAEGRVALISVSSSFDPSMIAGAQSCVFSGRPGINGLRLNSYMTLTKEEFDFVKNLADKTGINAEKNIIAKEGYGAVLDDDETSLGDLKFKLSDKSEYVVEAVKEDLERVKKSIFEAKLQADYIIVSVHSHQLSGDAKENPSKFLIDFAHVCIDEGANAVIGHGPHLLRPVEVYKDSPIFYSLGDFILQLYNVEVAPADFFEKQKLPSDATVHELLKKRSNGFTRGLMTDERMFLSVIPLFEMKDKKLVSLKLLPIMLNMNGNKSQIGLPRVCDAKRVIDYLGKMSEPFGVSLTENSDGTIECHW